VDIFAIFSQQVESMDDYVDPIIGHVEAVKKWPIMLNKPVFLLGHSMGGLIAMFTVFKKENLFKVQTKVHG
jgi:alpha-beta hydrolase superfamily lysophospholipase